MDRKRPAIGLDDHQWALNQLSLITETNMEYTPDDPKRKPSFNMDTVKKVNFQMVQDSSSTPSSKRVHQSKSSPNLRIFQKQYVHSKSYNRLSDLKMPVIHQHADEHKSSSIMTSIIQPSQFSKRQSIKSSSFSEEKAAGEENKKKRVIVAISVESDSESQGKSNSVSNSSQSRSLLSSQTEEKKSSSSLTESSVNTRKFKTGEIKPEAPQMKRPQKKNTMQVNVESHLSGQIDQMIRKIQRESSSRLISKIQRKESKNIDQFFDNPKAKLKQIYKEYISKKKQFKEISYAASISELPLEDPKLKFQRIKSKSSRTVRKTQTQAISDVKVKRTSNEFNQRQILFEDQFLALANLRLLWQDYETLREKVRKANMIAKRVQENKLAIAMRRTMVASKRAQTNYVAATNDINSAGSTPTQAAKVNPYRRMDLCRDLSFEELDSNETHKGHKNKSRRIPNRNKISSTSINLLEQKKKKELDWRKKHDKIFKQNLNRKITFIQSVIKYYNKFKDKKVVKHYAKSNRKESIRKINILTGKVLKSDKNSLSSSSSSFEILSSNKILHGDSEEEIKTDDSYFDEEDKLDLAPLNQKEIDDMMAEFNQIITKRELIKKAAKLDLFFLAANTVNNRNPPDTNINPVFKFISKLPMFKGSMEKLSKQQIKLVLSKIKIKLYQQGKVVFKQGEPMVYSFLILLGSVTCYDESIAVVAETNVKDGEKTSDNTKIKKEQPQPVGQSQGVEKTPGRGSNTHKRPVARFQSVFNLNYATVFPEQNESTKKQNTVEMITRKIKNLQLLEDSISNETGSLHSSDIEDFEMIPHVDQLRSMLQQKVKKYNAGEQIGYLGTDFETCQDFSGLASSDSIILVVERDIIAMLNQHKEKVRKDAICQFFMASLPKFNQVYTQHKISSHIHSMFTDRKYCKGDCVLVESREYQQQTLDEYGSQMVLQTGVRIDNYKKHHQAGKFFIIKEGQLQLIKRVAYLDEHQHVVFKNQTLLVVKEGDIIGEDSLIYNRQQFYTAQVTSIKCRVYVVDSLAFNQIFPRMREPLKEMFDQRLQVLEQVINQSKAVLSLNPKVINGQKNMYELLKEIELSKAYKYKDPTEPKIETRINNAIIRADLIEQIPNKDYYYNEQAKQTGELQTKLTYTKKNIRVNPQQVHLTKAERQFQKNLKPPQSSEGLRPKRTEIQQFALNLRKKFVDKVEVCIPSPMQNIMLHSFQNKKVNYQVAMPIAVNSEKTVHQIDSNKQNKIENDSLKDEFNLQPKAQVELLISQTTGKSVDQIEPLVMSEQPTQQVLEAEIEMDKQKDIQSTISSDDQPYPMAQTPNSVKVRVKVGSKRKPKKIDSKPKIEPAKPSRFRPNSNASSIRHSQVKVDPIIMDTKTSKLYLTANPYSNSGNWIKQQNKFLTLRNSETTNLSQKPQDNLLVTVSQSKPHNISEKNFRKYASIDETRRQNLLQDSMSNQILSARQTAIKLQKDLGISQKFKIKSLRQSPMRVEVCDMVNSANPSRKRYQVSGIHHFKNKCMDKCQKLIDSLVEPQDLNVNPRLKLEIMEKMKEVVLQNKRNIPETSLKSVLGQERNLKFMIEYFRAKSLKLDPPSMKVNKQVQNSTRSTNDNRISNSLQQNENVPIESLSQLQHEQGPLTHQIHDHVSDSIHSVGNPISKVTFLKQSSNTKISQTPYYASQVDLNPLHKLLSDTDLHDTIVNDPYSISNRPSSRPDSQIHIQSRHFSNFKVLIENKDQPPKQVRNIEKIKIFQLGQSVLKQRQYSKQRREAKQSDDNLHKPIISVFRSQSTMTQNRSFMPLNCSEERKIKALLCSHVQNFFVNENLKLNEANQASDPYFANSQRVPKQIQGHLRESKLRMQLMNHPKTVRNKKSSVHSNQQQNKSSSPSIANKNQAFNYFKPNSFSQTLLGSRLKSVSPSSIQKGRKNDYMESTTHKVRVGNIKDLPQNTQNTTLVTE